MSELLKDIAKSRREYVQLAVRADTPEQVAILDDCIGKLDILHLLADAWLEEKLSNVILLTDKRLELDLAECDRMLVHPLLANASRNAIKYWERKRNNLLLLQRLVQAWHGEMLAETKFTVNIQE